MQYKKLDEGKLDVAGAFDKDDTFESIVEEYLRQGYKIISTNVYGEDHYSILHLVR